MYGLHPKKGTIAVGADADIAIWDPERKVTIRQEILHHGSDYTPYEGLEVTGWPVTTIVRGETVVRNGALVGPPQCRPPHRPRPLALCHARRGARAIGLRARQSRLLQANAVRLPPSSGQSGTYSCVPTREIRGSADRWRSEWQLIGSIAAYL